MPAGPTSEAHRTEIDAALASVEALAGAAPPRAARQRKTRRRKTRRRSLPARLGLWLLGIAVALLLPFGVLVRGAVAAYTRLGLPGWAALLCGAAATVLVLLGYAFVVRRRPR